MMDIDKELMRRKDRLTIALSWIGIITGIFTIISVTAGIFISIYVRPVEAKLDAHICKNEPETSGLILKVNTLEVQYSEILKKLNTIETMISNRMEKLNVR